MKLIPSLLRLILLISIQSCTPKMQASNTLPIFDKEGHRGCRGLMPENTIPAMLKAIELGVTTLEMDVMITKDKEVVVSHEPFFNHEITTLANGTFTTSATEKSWNIYQLTYQQVSNIDVGIKPHPRFPQQQKIKATKPLLSTLIDSVETYCKQHNLPPVRYNIEIKSTPATDTIFHPIVSEYADLLMKVITDKKIKNRVVIQSFDFRALQYMHKHYTSIPLAMLIEDDDKRTLEEQINALGFVPAIYSPAYVLLTKAVVDAAHNKKLKVIPWTVNDKAAIEKLQQMGVDGIITDYPNLF
jgi:glycerophosphoryl diester phosphodiesterase